MEKKINCFIIENVSMDKLNYRVNEFISFSTLPDNKKILVTIIYDDTSEYSKYRSNGVLFYHALQLSLPKLNIKVSKPMEPCELTVYEILRGWNSPLFKFYSSIGDDIEEDSSSLVITNTELEEVKKFHSIIIEHSQSANELRKEESWKATRWSYAYNSYVSACLSPSLENSNQMIITGMEALLVKGDGNTTYRVSLNASIIVADEFESRKKIFEVVKKMYNLRSKATHGEVSELVRLLKKNDVYDNYFELKRIFAQVLLKTYKKSEEEIFDKLDLNLLSCPSF